MRRKYASRFSYSEILNSLLADENAIPLHASRDAG